jgi:hypothetical protein
MSINPEEVLNFFGVTMIQKSNNPLIIINHSSDKQKSPAVTWGFPFLPPLSLGEGSGVRRSNSAVNKHPSPPHARAQV